MKNSSRHVLSDNIRISDDKNSVIIIDQSKLPNEKKYISLHNIEDCYDAIYNLRVRGAPAIGICGAYSIYILAKQIAVRDYSAFLQRFKSIEAYLNSSRPTAVNLSWALNKMEDTVVKNRDLSIESIIDKLYNTALSIHLDDIEMCKKISQYGLSLLSDGDGILTHCNAGPLATSRYGTGLGPILLGKEKGYNFKVFSDETRPLLQGARLTSYELEKANVDVTLICDNMASIVMRNGWVNACLVGCDRIAANGDVANKIGTSGVAILAKHYNIPFYVLGPTSTVDMKCKCGNDIVIEERNPSEIKNMFFKESTALDETKCYNPAFDITDNTLITAIITEKGICGQPYSQSIKKLFEQE